MMSLLRQWKHGASHGTQVALFRGIRRIPLDSRLCPSSSRQALFIREVVTQEAGAQLQTCPTRIDDTGLIRNIALVMLVVQDGRTCNLVNGIYLLVSDEASGTMRTVQRNRSRSECTLSTTESA